jgi:hypothetical protein
VADDIVVIVDPAAVREMFRDWGGPVGQAVDEVTREIADIAQALAPVSPHGSRLAPPGFLREHTRPSAEHHYDDATGEVLGLAGAPVYPFAFISNVHGFTHNPRSGKRPGRGSVRKADDDYLARAVDAAPHIVIGTP